MENATERGFMQNENNNKKNGFEYNLATNLAEIIKKYKFSYSYIQLDFVNKSNKKISGQTTFFLDSQGNLKNGGKE